MSVETEDDNKRFGIPEGHTLRLADQKWEARKGQDTDTYIYDELNEAGAVVARWEKVDSTSMHPPFARHVSHTKLPDPHADSTSGR